MTIHTLLEHALIAPTSMSASTTNVSDLPLPLRTRIVSAVRALPRPPPLQPSLHHLQKLYLPLPAELLTIAQSSSTLSSAVADTLGVRALILTSQVAKSDLPKWIAALAPFVKAVSFWGIPWDFVYRSEDIAKWLATAITALKAITAPHVALRTLDITDIASMNAHEKKAAFQELLVGALASNRDSLRELAMPMCEICINALQQVPLPNLQVVQFGEVGRGETKTSFINALRALKGHVDEDRGESGLVELRMTHVHEPPCTSVQQSGCCEAFFKRIRTLDIRTFAWGEEADNIAAFTALFPQINCFRWNGSVTPKVMQEIIMACPQLKELHLSPWKRYHDGDMGDLLRMLAIARGKLRTLRIKATMSEELVRLLGETNPDLETFSAEIGPDNVGALTPLLAHCRRLRTLDLSFLNPDEEKYQCLGSEGWRRFAEAVQSASTELRDVIVDSGDDRCPPERDVNGLVDAIVSVLESLKDRARIVRFLVPAGMCRFDDQVDALCRLLDVATTKCSNLDVLVLDLHMADVDEIWENLEEVKIKCRQMLQAQKTFRDAATHLHYFYLGGMGDHAESWLQEIEEGWYGPVGEGNQGS